MEGKMQNYDESIEAIRSERAQAKMEQDLAQKRSRVVRLEEEFRGFGHEDAVCKFKKAFVEGGTLYSYAAINVSGRWYTTGETHPQGYNEEDFILWLASGLGAEVTWLEPTA
jgi:hypothetical protein